MGGGKEKKKAILEQSFGERYFLTKKDMEWPSKWMKLHSKSTRLKGGRGTRAKGGELNQKAACYLWKVTHI